jgi:hypothetical protein
MSMDMYISEPESDTETEPETDCDSDTLSFSTENSETIYYDVNMSTNTTNKYVLLIPELYNKYIHGKTSDSDPNINGQFMVLQKIRYNETRQMFRYTDRVTRFYKQYYLKNFGDSEHDIIRNYKNIITNPNYLNLEIGHVYYLKGDECVCVIKTFWLRLVQRAWKKIYKRRMLIKQKRSRPTSLFYRQFSAKWPEDCNYMPSIRGMLL